MEQKSENNSTESVGRIISFCLHHLIPQASTAQHQEGILWPERVPLIRAGCTSFPSPSGHCTKELFWFCPTQKPAKLRKLETARNKENGQYHLGSVHYSVTSTPLCGGSAAFSTEETNSQHSYHSSSYSFLSWEPHRLHLQTPAAWVPPLTQLPTPTWAALAIAYVATQSQYPAGPFCLHLAEYLPLCTCMPSGGANSH